MGSSRQRSTVRPRRAGALRATLLVALAGLAAITVEVGMAADDTRSVPAPAKAPAASREVAVLAGGCFWGMQDILRKIPGVLETEVGYTGGWVVNPRYEDTHDSRSGHAEAVRVVFDPRVLSYADLLEKWFFRMHDPTTPNRQGNDVGTQYRSAIFYEDEAQRATAEAVKKRVQASGKWKGTIVTEIVKASTWYPAEGYHQDYLVKNPGGYTCHFLRP
jgi:methionine-S-sulfoxide reductase